ncbi:sulfite reductase [Niabella ginsenosidivorans]|uniref:assimilatory sulfite reductase (NADPH) n=1 Tax=Niabella ginsenosidivorans TaxID=1176587 RepID=A0A1A9I586_9BACT|nr:flavodoxin domain-containing protein [Niabella ginsenosidivorans]ANH82796.1 sulfite reductase [Niabella ginsenosidivorans]
MLSDVKLGALKSLTPTLTRDELLWASGYFAGLAQGIAGGQEPIAAAPAAVKKIALVYGTETGNAKKLATQLAGIAKKKGITVKLTGLDQYRFADLPKEEYFFVVISTQGEGEPPVQAKKFYEHIHENQIDLSKLKFGVLGLGDSSYPEFCKTGEDVDARLEALGGHRLLPLKKCDVDYEEDALHWLENVIAVLQTSAAHAAPIPSLPTEKKPSGKKYYNGKVITNINLNDRGSRKQTFHIEIVTEEPIDYEPGDALGIVPSNKQDMINKIIGITGIDPDKEIKTEKITATVRDLLSQHLNICYLLKATVKKFAELTGQQIPDTRMSLYDLLRIYPVKDAAQFEEVIKILTAQSPRLYSISSSPNAHGENEIHITVSKNQFTVEDEERYGVCSEFLSDLDEGHEIEFFIQKARHFKLPEESKDVIMIGPGTGIAPFRSFLAERDATGASGKNWLFFGEQHFVTDFLYQTEIQSYLATGVLNNIDLAFSRDTDQKIYVQHRIKEKGDELIRWLNDGAYLYICGAKDPMCSDVEATFIELLQSKGKSKEEARSFLTQLEEEGRYSKDVY